MAEVRDGGRDLLAARLALVGRPGDEADQARLLQLALTQAVGALGGLGGLAHLAGPRDSLRLAAVSGVPDWAARPWEVVEAASDTAPMRALTSRSVTWSTRAPGPGAAAQAWAGVLSAPLTAADGTPVGALSVLLDSVAEGARPELDALARATSARLPAVRRYVSGSPPWWQLSDPRGQGRQMMQRVEVASWEWDLTTGILHLDEIAESMLPLAGLDARTWDRHIEGWMARIHPADRPGVELALQKALDTGGPYAVIYRILDREDRISWLELRGTLERAPDGAEPRRMVGTARNVTEEHSRGMWVAGLHEGDPDPVYVMRDDRVEWANAAGRDLAGGENVTIAGQVLWEVVPQLRAQGLPELLSRVRAAPAATSTTRLRIDRPDGETVWYQARAAEVGGYVLVHWADITAQTRTEQAAAERSRRWDALNDALIRAVDTDDVVTAISTHVLPMVGASGLVLHDLSGPEPRIVGITGHRDADAFGAALAATPWSDRLEATALESGPQYIPSLDELRRRWPRLLPLAHLGGQQAWAVVPLVVSHEVVGTAVITWSRPRRFDAADRSLLGTVSVVTAHALRAAAAHDEARRHAEHLQRELLPGPLPSLSGIRAASRYRTSSDGQGVGGHWYDVLPLPGGRVLAVVGEVTTGPDAVVDMGILRQSVLTMAGQDLPPDEMLAHVNDVVHRLSGRLGGGTVTATCLLVCYDPSSGECVLASAGHPPPVVMCPGESPAVLEMPVGEPLGVAQVPAEAEARYLPAGTLLVLATEGLLPADDGPAPQRLTGVLTDRQAAEPLGTTAEGPARDGWLERTADAVTDELPAARGDSRGLALLALLTGRLRADHVLERTLPREPRSAGSARGYAAEALEGWGRRDMTDIVQLIVSELVGNSVRHAVGLGKDAAEGVAGDIRLRLLNLESEIVCEVYDGSEATPRVRHPSFEDEFGRGLMMIALSASSWGTRYIPSGKCIWASVPTG